MRRCEKGEEQQPSIQTVYYYHIDFWCSEASDGVPPTDRRLPPQTVLSYVVVTLHYIGRRAEIGVQQRIDETEGLVVQEANIAGE